MHCIEIIWQYACSDCTVRLISSIQIDGNSLIHLASPSQIIKFGDFNNSIEYRTI